MSGNRDDNASAKRLGRQLKRIRIAAGYTTQAALGKRVGWGEDSMSKGETGVQPPAESLFTAWIEACRTSIDGQRQVLTEGEIQALTDLWETVREAQVESAVPEFAQPWFEAEAAAEFLRLWAPLLVPGLFQTPDYIHDMHVLAGGVSEEKAAEQVTLRLQRQSILRGPDPVQVITVLHQSVLYQLIGSPPVMASQVAHLLEMSEMPNVTIQVTRGPGAYHGLAGPFQIASTHGETDTVVMPAIEDQTSKEPMLTRKAAILFEQIRRHALSMEDSLAIMTEARDHWNSQQ